MATLENCSECGAPLKSSLGGDLCAVCLIDDALGSASIAPVRGPLGNIGGLDLIEVIARGGMGIVYRARQNQPQRDVALKALSGADLLEDEARERFRIELEATASLDHPAILPVYESGEEGGVPFFTMKLATGGTLAGRVSSYAGNWQEIAGLMIWVAEAVHFAHERGVIHRDIKPGNILFDENGKAYVSDFGLAKLLGRQSDLTRSIAMLGTPHYLAPEVAAKNAAAAGPASDIWALGAVLFELLAGHTPFAADSVPSLLRSIVEDEPKKLPPEVPAPLKTIVLKALCKDPARRYVSAACLADDLGRWLRGDAILARPTHAIERLWMKSRKSPRLVLFGLLAFVCLICVIGLEIHRRAESVKSQGVERAMQEEIRARLLDQSRAGRLEKHAGWREAGLQALRQAAAIRPDADLRDEAIAHLAGYDLKEVPPAGNPIPLRDAWDADSNREAIRIGDAIQVRQRNNGRVVAEFKDLRLSGTVPMIIGPGGRMVIVEKSQIEVILLDVSSGKVVGSWMPSAIMTDERHGDVVFVMTYPNPDAPELQPGFTVTGVSMRDGARFPPLEVAGRYEWVSAICNSPDQPFIAVADGDSFGIWNWKTGKRVYAKTLDPPITKMHWKGDRLLALDASGGLAMFNVSKKHFEPFPLGAKKTEDLGMTADGRVILLRDQNNLTTALQADNLETLVRMPRTSLVGPRILLSETPPEVVEKGRDGKRCRQLVLPDVVKSIPFSALGLPQGGRAHYSPDGRWLLLSSEKELRIVDHATDTVILTMACENSFGAVFSEDGRHFILCGKKTISLHELFTENRQLKVRHVRDLKRVAGKFSSYPSLSYNRRWLSIPETPERMLVLDCRDFETWQSFPATGAANVTWATGDGRWLVAGSRSNAGLRLWDRQAGGEARVLRAGNSSPKFSPDDRWLAEKDLDNAHITIYDTSNWKPVFQTLPIDEEWPGSIDWSPDSRMLAISMASNKVRLIEAGTWRTLANLDGATQDVGQALFSPCGRYLLESSEALIEIWDLTVMSKKLSALGLPLEFPSRLAVPAPPQGLAEPLLAPKRPSWMVAPDE